MKRRRIFYDGNRIVLGCALFTALCVLGLGNPTSLSGNHAQGPGSALRVLFIGNSYTYVNDLPGMFAGLGRSGGHRVETGMAAKGGWTLSAHAGSSETLDKLKWSKWDFVVLQEQSQVPSVEQYRVGSMYPAARSLVRQIKATGAAPVFFLTWAHREGWPKNGLNGYESMQLQIERGYLAIGQELHVVVAPIGYAWLMARRHHPHLDLWQRDGSHPKEQGTYLAASVFYATLFRQSPEGLAYLAHLPEEIAHELQRIASQAVLKKRKQWNLL
jgi:hypothetical protein